MKAARCSVKQCESRLEDITLSWYLSEPAFFLTYCTHTLVENTTIDVPFRSGQMRIEYNPHKIALLDDTQLEYLFRQEILFIMFGYPYLGSDGISGGHDGCSTSLWGKDEASYRQIAQSVQQAKQWGKHAGVLKEQVPISSFAAIDYRMVLRQFRASVISNKRCLTRMKPNRRTGFTYCGSKYDFSTKLLAAVDVSGSISVEDISHFYTVIRSFFVYGVQSIEVLLFDRKIQSGPIALHKVQRSVTVTGRGGTSYEPVIDFIIQHDDSTVNSYDGCIIFTDGNAKAPYVPPQFKQEHHIVWICSSRQSFEENKNWMQKTGSVCFLR